MAGLILELGWLGERVKMINTKTGTPKLKQFANRFFSRGIITKISLAFVLFVIFCSICAPFLTPYDPNKNDLASSMEGPSKKHLLGTDVLGRDVLTRLIFGARVSLIAGILSCLLAGAVGMILGFIAAYYRGIVEKIIMRYVDIQLAIPPLLFTMIIGLMVGHGLGGLTFAIAFGLLPGFIRLMYGIVLSIKEDDYILALTLANIPNIKIFYKHVVPNSFPPLLVMFAMSIGSAILLESTLSFLGIGIQSPTASWGNMVAEGYKYIFTDSLLTFLPGICITLVVITFNIISDGLRDALDPRLRGKL
jgi:peptide/nickel transport system permease protein